MKRTALFCFGLLVFGGSLAHADEYVCELTLVPAVVAPSMGANGYLSFFTSDLPACGGATTQRFLCSAGASNKLCGVQAQYSEAALIGIYESMRSAEADQHKIVPYWNACIGGGNQSCVGGIMLYPDF